jgi:hypothetical protein
MLRLDLPEAGGLPVVDWGRCDDSASCDLRRSNAADRSLRAEKRGASLNAVVA